MKNKLLVKGNDYEMGYQIGTHFKDYLSKNVEKFNEALKKPEIYQRVKHNEGILKNSFPSGLDEIYGRADGAGISRDAYLLWLFPEVFKLVDGCTTLTLIDENGKVLFCHNEDDKNYSTDNVAFIKYQYADRWYIGYGPAEKLGGSCFGLNSDGLLFSSNYIYPDHTNLDYVSRYVMVRSVMNCSSLEACIEKLKEIKVASPFSLNIVDTKNNRAVNVEKDTDEVYIHEITDRWARSNHFIIKQSDLTNVPFNTKFRHEKPKELLDKLDKNAKITDLKKILDYYEDEYTRCVYKDPDKYDRVTQSVTVANLSYDGNTQEIVFTDYLNKTVEKMKFGEFEE